MGIRNGALVVLCFAALLPAQEFRATITGRVLDPACAPVANAKVRLTNAATTESRDVISDGQGNYLVPLLNPAVYTLRVEAPGFKTAVSS